MPGQGSKADTDAVAHRHRDGNRVRVRAQVAVLDRLLKPGASGKISGEVGDAWQLDGPRGCIGEFISGAAARITVEKA